MNKVSQFGFGYAAATGSLLGSMFQHGTMDMSIVVALPFVGGFLTVLGASALRAIYKKLTGL